MSQLVFSNEGGFLLQGLASAPLRGRRRGAACGEPFSIFLMKYLEIQSFSSQASLAAEKVLVVDSTPHGPADRSPAASLLEPISSNARHVSRACHQG